MARIAPPKVLALAGLFTAAGVLSSCQWVSGLNDYELVATAWQKSWGGEGGELVTTVAVDAQDNVLLAGGFSSPVSFGGETLYPGGTIAPSGTLDPFIVKLNVSGGHLWSQSFLSSDLALPNTMAVTPEGNIAIAGMFTGTMDLGGETLQSGPSAAVFVAQLAADGTPQWGRTFTGYALASLEEFENAPALAADSNGDLVMRMRLPEPLQVFDEQLTPMGADDFALVRISPDGNKRWVRHIVSGQDELPDFVPALRPPLAIDAQGRIVVAGHFRSTFAVDGTELQAQTFLDVFVARFGADGGLLDARAFGGNGGQFATALAVDEPGNVVVSGAYVGELNIDGTPFPGLGGPGPDVFLSVFNAADLSHQRTFTFAAAAADNEPESFSAYVVSVDVADNGDVLMSGAIDGSISFGQDELVALGATDMFFAKLNAAGEPIVATRYGGLDEDIAFDGVLDGRGHVVVGGSFFGQLKVGADTLASNGGSDAFVIKWVP